MIHNYTPHPVTLVGVGTIPSKGIARLTEFREKTLLHSYGESTPVQVPITPIRYGGVVGLPKDYDRTGDIYIVSRPVAEFLKRPYVCCPDRYIRDADGQVIACEGLCYFV